MHNFKVKQLRAQLEDTDLVGITFAYHPRKPPSLKLSLRVLHANNFHRDFTKLLRIFSCKKVSMQNLTFIEVHRRPILTFAEI